MSRLLRKAKQAGKDGVKFQFDVTLHRLENMPPGDSFYVAFKRGPKCTLSMEHSGLTGVVEFNEEVLSMIATLYSSKSGGGFDKKEAKFTVKEVKRKGEKPLGSVIVDLSEFVLADGQQPEVRKMPLKSKKNVKGQPSIVLTVMCRRVRDRSRTVQRARPLANPNPSTTTTVPATTTASATADTGDTGESPATGADRPLKHAYIPSDEEDEFVTFTARGYDSDGTLSDSDEDLDDTMLDASDDDDDEPDAVDPDMGSGGGGEAGSTGPSATTTAAVIGGTAIAAGAGGAAITSNSGGGSSSSSSAVRVGQLEARIAELEASLAESEGKRKDLANEFAESSDKADTKYQELQVQLDAKEAELSQTNSALKSRKAEEKQVSKLESEISQLEAQCTELRDENSALKSQSSNAEALEQASLNAEKYRGKYKESKRLCEVVEEARQELEDEVEELQRKYDALEEASRNQAAQLVAEATPARRKRAPTLSATMADMQARGVNSDRALSEYQAAVEGIVGRLREASNTEDLAVDAVYKEMKHLGELSALANLFIQACQSGAESQAMTILAEANTVQASVQAQQDELAQVTEMLIMAKLQAAESEDGRLQAVQKCTELKRLLNKSRTQKMALGQRVSELEVQLANAPIGGGGYEVERADDGVEL